MKAPAHYTDLRTACLPHMTYYHRDLLVYDRRAIRTYPDLPFLHVTRDMGSHIHFLREGDHPTWPGPGETVPYLFATADRWHLLKEGSGFIAYFVSNHLEANILVHHWDGRQLHRINYAKAATILAEWERRVRSHWNKPIAPMPARPAGISAESLCIH